MKKFRLFAMVCVLVLAMGALTACSSNSGETKAPETESVTATNADTDAADTTEAAEDTDAADTTEAAADTNAEDTTEAAEDTDASETTAE